MKKTKIHLLMIMLIAIWTMDALTISAAVEELNQVFLLCSKYLCALPIVLVYVWKTEGLHLPEKRDIPRLIVSVLCGDITYFLLEYTAMKYIPMSMVTIMLSTLPAAAYAVDCVVHRRRPDGKTLLMIVLSVVGIVMVAANGELSVEGSAFGYLCCIGCIAAWIAYGYITRSIDEKYSSSAIALMQMSLAVVMMLPFALMNVPQDISSRDLWICIILIGCLSSGIGCLIEVKGLIELGLTISGVYLNLFCVSSAVAGMLVLHESMTPVQIIGAVAVVSCAIGITLRGDA